VSELERPTGIVFLSAALSAIPTLGGPIQTLFDELYAGRRSRMESTAQEILEAVGGDGLISRLQEDPRLEPLLGEALEAAARTGFEAKRRLLGRTVRNALQDDAAIDPAVVMVLSMSQLEPVHVRALVWLERVIGPVDETFTDRTALEEFNRSQPIPVLATLETSGVVIPATSWTGRGLGVETISDFGREVLRELRAADGEDMERLQD
jgi:hypothetical protein